MQVDRRTFVAGGVAGTLAAAPGSASTPTVPAVAALARFAVDYVAIQNAPGMIVGIADRDGWSETAAYGLADLEARRPIRADERFRIGSITKSFTALMILQLVDEGRIALDTDITRYLPDLPLKAPFGSITVHHLLCHLSGLPGGAQAINGSEGTVEQAFAPGAHFHYSNVGYDWLGRIVEVRGGESWTRALHRRVLDPLGMTQTSTVIGAGMRRREVPSYSPREDDRPFPRHGALTRAGPLTLVAASGCLASTAADMNRYILMLARRGAGPGGKLLSSEGFALMVRQHVATDRFGPGGGYGYGWMTGTVDGRAVIRHTGGMNSFVSSIHVDPDGGYGAFAAINAQQNYRPVPVTVHALRILRARAGNAPCPETAAFDPAANLALDDYTGDYRDGDRVARVSVFGRRLNVAIDGLTLVLEGLGGDRFACATAGHHLFTFCFRRDKAAGDGRPGRRGAVLTLGWARDHFVRSGATAPPFPVADRSALTRTQLRAYEGLYAADGGWPTCVRVIARADRLWVDSPEGVTPLASINEDRFRFADQAHGAEIVTFTATSAAARTMSFSGSVMVRIGDPFLNLE